MIAFVILAAIAIVCKANEINCTSSQFGCDEGKCISNSLVCDGVPDCADLADENENCTCNKTDEFRCNNGACISDNLACDGFPDCKDSSDEGESCSCKSNEFRCKDGHCIPAIWVCDGFIECPDGSDEGILCSPTSASQPPSTSSDGGGGQDDGGDGCWCFPPNALVHTHDGLVQVKDIQLGTRVLAVDANGTLVYSPIIAMLHASEKEVADYVVIRTSSHRQIVLTTTHLIYKAENKNELMSKDISLQESSLVFASTVKEGDLIFEATPDGSLQPRRVLSITNKKIRGVYAPLTKEGTIVIDNFAASCYAFINDHHYAHLGFAPLRYLYDMLPSAFIGKQTDGIAWYPRLLQALGGIFLDENSFYPIQARQDVAI